MESKNKINDNAYNAPEIDNVHHLYGQQDYSESTSTRESWQGMVEKLYADINRLWVKESQLVRTEINEKISDVKTAIVSLAAGGALLLIGAFSAAATATIALAKVVDPAIASLIVTAVLLVVGFIMLSAAKKKLDADKLKPKHSVDAFGEIKNTFQERIHEFKKH